MSFNTEDLPPFYNCCSHNDHANDKEDCKDGRNTARCLNLTELATVTIRTLADWFPFLHHTAPSAITELRITGLATHCADQHLIFLSMAVLFVRAILAILDLVTKPGGGEALVSVSARLRACWTLQARYTLRVIYSNVTLCTAACMPSRVCQAQLATTTIILCTLVGS